MSYFLTGLLISSLSTDWICTRLIAPSSHPNHPLRMNVPVHEGPILVLSDASALTLDLGSLPKCVFGKITTLRWRGGERVAERERERWSGGGGFSNHIRAGSGREPITGAEQDGFHGDDAGMMSLYWSSKRQRCSTERTKGGPHAPSPILALRDNGSDDVRCLECGIKEESVEIQKCTRDSVNEVHMMNPIYCFWSNSKLFIKGKS